MANKKRSNNDIYQSEIVATLHSYKIWTRSSITGRFTQTDVGSADLMAHSGGRGCAIEIKTGRDNSFIFSNWRENQRQWAVDYMHDTHCLYWLAIVIENIPVKVARLRVARACFFVPYRVMIETEKQMPQASIPGIATIGMNLEVQNKLLDAEHLWGKYQLIYDRGWKFPETHPFYKFYLEEKTNA